MPKEKVSQTVASVPPPVMPINGAGGFDVNAMQAETPPLKPAVKVDFNLDAMRAPDEPSTPAESELLQVSVRKPRGTEIYYVHPEWRYTAYVIQPFDFRKPWYAVKPKVAKLYPAICQRAELVPYANDDGELFLWPLVLEDSSGNTHEYNRSARELIARGAGKWCQYKALQGKQMYTMEEAEVQRDPPEWPEGGMAYMLDNAFEDRIIDDPEHEAIRLRRTKKVPVK